MHSFLSKFAGAVRGVLCGLDRVFLRGTLRGITYTKGLKRFLGIQGVLLKDFGDYSQQVSSQLHEASLQQARQQGREIRYLNSAHFSKEAIAREIAARDHIKEGLICVLRSVDPCMSFQVVKNPQTRHLELRYRPRKCLHLYHYHIHPVFGFMHARIQTWFPFHIYLCLNGREWLARQLDRTKQRYVRRDNTFTWLEDLPAAQALLDVQLHADWPALLDPLAASLNPVQADLFPGSRLRYHWSVADSEWASDVMFRARADLEQVYPALLRYAVTTFGTAQVLRFFGQPVPCSGQVPHRCRHEVSTNVRERQEGTRLKHWFNNNNLKLYDKGSVLRVECTLREPQYFKVYRAAEDNPHGPPAWRPLRKGIADLAGRARVSQAANERYLEALAAVHLTVPLQELAGPLGRPVLDVSVPRPAPSAMPPTAVSSADSVAGALTPTAAAEPAPHSSRPRRVRALNPLAPDDARLLEIVGRPEFMLQGLRNRDVRWLLFGGEGATAAERRQRCAVVTRKLRLLRAHGLLDKVPHTHRYVVSAEGRKAITVLLAARHASTEQLLRSAC
jgi:hypothetical protein